MTLCNKTSRDEGNMCLKTDERQVNGDMRGGERQRGNVEDEKSLVNKGSIGDE